MLKQKIISTLKFFDLQSLPLTLLELHKYLLAGDEDLRKVLNSEFEVIHKPLVPLNQTSPAEILTSIETECQGEVEQKYGFYCLKGKTDLVNTRLENYLYGVPRERRIRKWSKFLRHIPFVRGVALGGSQALGLEKKESDIDLFIIVQPEFMWLARTLVTIYFQIFGLRRHGKKIANRFCLNHYVAGPKELTEIRNLYSAMEYARHRPLVYQQNLKEFHRANSWWMQALFPNFAEASSGAPGLEFTDYNFQEQSAVQKTLEKMFSGNFGKSLEKRLQKLQESRIRKEKFIIVQSNELSFHPDSKQQGLLEKFFAG